MRNDSKYLVEKLPEGYEFGGRWQISLKPRKLALLVACMVLAFVVSIAAGLILRGLLTGSWEGNAQSGIFELLIITGAVIGVIVLHETVHALMFIIYNTRPRFGFKVVGGAFAAAYTTVDKPVTRNQYIAVCLAPAIINLLLLAVIVLANNDLLVLTGLVALGINSSGSAGDVLIYLNIRKHPKSTIFKDEEDGFSWFNHVGTKQ